MSSIHVHAFAAIVLLMRSIILIAHNLRSTYNVGSLLRTADGLGIDKVFLTGYTPFPLQNNDERLPHLAQKIDGQIHKTALGAEKSVHCEHRAEIFPLLDELHSAGYVTAALEQTEDAAALPSFSAPDKIALIVGREVEGIEPEILKQVDMCLEIPMFGKKESFNVAQAAAMAMYHLRFSDLENRK